jgi:asparagine synthase (glutamine-hydrolysing)
MSALAGIFKFDPTNPVNQKDLTALARGIDRIGPDGGNDHLTPSLGMAFRAFHTTPESRFEIQPLVRQGSVLTWDGRLDNREEIRTRVSRKYDKTPTDLDLVFAAYEEWGTSCFAELNGDWAIALWDEEKHKLILARDYIGVRRLFYRLDGDGVAWCTTIEPLALTSQRFLHLDLDYLSGCLYPRPPVGATPYREIRSVIPASFQTFEFGGKQTDTQYWSLNPYAQIRYRTDSEYEAHFREVFGESIKRRLRADCTLLAELSGGLDSSSIVCMADHIRGLHPGAAIETMSYYDTDEPSGDERPYFTLVEDYRGRVGHHISLSDFTRQSPEDGLAPLPDDHFTASPGYFARSLRWASAIDGIQRQVQAKVILSGLGGDEVLGGVQYEAPELADHLLAGRLILFLQSTLRWSLARKKTVYRLLIDTFELIRASHHPESLLVASGRSLPWSHLAPVRRHVALKSFAHWRKLSPLPLCMESTRYSLAQQLTCTDPPLTGCAETRYPFLDRSCFVFLASIPRTQVLQAGRRRHLMRRALSGIVPDEILSRKTKWFGFRNSVAVLANQRKRLESLFEDAWLSEGVVVDSVALRNHLEAVQHGTSGEGQAIRSAIAIEQWLRSQLRYGILDLHASETNRHTVVGRAESIS